MRGAVSAPGAGAASLARRARGRTLDVTLAGLVVCAVGLFLWRVHVGLDYHWAWEAMPQFLLRTTEAGLTGGILLHGLADTVRLSLWSMTLALCAGTAAGLCRTANRPLLRWLAATYVGVVRNLPPLVLIFIMHFFISARLLPDAALADWVRSLGPSGVAWLELVAASPQRLGGFVAGVLTLGLYEGAYMAEIVRAGVESVPRGQWEVSASCGLSRWQQLRHVVLPQAFRVITPALAGQSISTIKDSAIVSVISIQELTFRGMELMASTFLTFEIWLTIAGLYLLLTSLCSCLARWLERRMRWVA